MALSSRVFYLGVIFWVGLSALIYQIYGVKVLFMFFVENTHAVSIAVSSFLAGLAVSSLLFSRLTRSNSNSRKIVCYMMLAACAYGYGFLVNYQWVPILLDSIRANFPNRTTAGVLKFCIMWFYLFPPAFFLGGSFPLLNSLYLQSVESSARDTGTVYFWDTLGAIVGALLAGFVLLPQLGLHATAATAASINLLLCIVLLEKRSYAVIGSLVLVIIVLLEVSYVLKTPDKYFALSDNGHIIEKPTKDMDKRFGTVLFRKESPYGQITVGKVRNLTTLFINYRAMCYTGTYSERSLAREALAHIKPGSKVLNIGLGCGYTASELAANKNVSHLDIVEINPVIPETAPYFSKETNDVLNQPKVSLHIQNGADWLRNTKEKYDAIVIDIEEISVIHSSPLYTREYYDIIKGRLNEGGVFALWSFTVSPEFTRVMYNTLKSAYPHVRIQYEKDGTNYYSTVEPFEMPETSENKEFVKQVMAISNNDINTVGNLVLEKYYDSNRLFELDENYREKTVKYKDSK